METSRRHIKLFRYLFRPCLGTLICALVVRACRFMEYSLGTRSDRISIRDKNTCCFLFLSSIVTLISMAVLMRNDEWDRFGMSRGYMACCFLFFFQDRVSEEKTADWALKQIVQSGVVSLLSLCCGKEISTALLVQVSVSANSLSVKLLPLFPVEVVIRLL